MCKVEGCNRDVRARGYCQTHYQKFLKYGESLEPAEKKKPGPKPDPSKPKSRYNPYGERGHNDLAPEVQEEWESKERPKKSHCSQGHPFDEENTYIDPKGYWQCRTCRRERMQLRREEEEKTTGPPNSEKTHCPRGHEYTEENTFWMKSKTSRSGYSRACRECNRLNMSVQNIKRYGIDPKQFEQKLLDQNNSCAICGREFGENVKRHIDHDHTCCPPGGSCGKCLRGILCSQCNHGLGKFNDDPDLLEVAAQYLRSKNG